MSWTENPFVHMNIALAPPAAAWEYLTDRQKALWRIPNTAHVGCDSCGAMDVSRGQLRSYDSLEIAQEHFLKHVRDSHGLTVEQCQSWSWE
jgi:hypothetical protein